MEEVEKGGSERRQSGEALLGGAMVVCAGAPTLCPHTCRCLYNLPGSGLNNQHLRTHTLRTYKTREREISDYSPLSPVRSDQLL